MKGAVCPGCKRNNHDVYGTAWLSSIRSVCSTPSVNKTSYENKNWINDVMINIRESMDDLPTLELFAKINKIGNEKFLFEKNNSATMIDSAIFSSNELELHATNEVPQDMQETSFVGGLEMENIGQDRDNPKNMIKFEGQDWEQHDNNWRAHQKKDKSTISEMVSKNVAAQSDSRANRIVKDDLSILTNVKIIAPYPMGGCNKTDPAAIICTATGELTLTSMDNTKISVKACFSEQVDGTIISPTTMVVQHKERYVGWLQHANIDNKDGTIRLLGRQGHDDIIFKTYMKNDLWYHDQDSIGQAKPKINRLINNSANYELWHQRLAYPGMKTMQCMHHHAKGVPKLKGNAFYACPSCLPEKLSKKATDDPPLHPNVKTRRKLILSSVPHHRRSDIFDGDED